MADKKFEAILTLLVPQVVQLICENYPVDELMASTSSSGRKKDVESIVWTAVRGVALAMGIAVTVLSVLDELETEAGLGMLGIAVACISIFLLRDREK